MDCPLNWAHQQDRKAEALVNHQKFADAIVCHQKAAEFLQEAMKMTQVQQALISMQLQFENHCRQQKIVKDKWRRCEIQQEKLMQERVQMLQKQERQHQEIIAKELPHKDKVKESDDMVDNKQTECSQSSSLVISAENFSVSSTSSSSDCIASKDEKTVIKDLETQVNDLQMRVLSLSQNLEDSNRENSRLKKALDNIQEFVKLRFGFELGDEFFDANQVNDKSVNESEDFACDTAFRTDCTAVNVNGDCKSEHRVGQRSLEEDTVEAGVGLETSDREMTRNIVLPPLETPQFNFEYDNSSGNS